MNSFAHIIPINPVAGLEDRKYNFDRFLKQSICKDLAPGTAKVAQNVFRRRKREDQF